VNGENVDLWENGWISSTELKNVLKTSNIIVGSALETSDVVQPEEVDLFTQNAWLY
jgi:hypothetical protein